MTFLEEFGHWVGRSAAPKLWAYARTNGILHVPFSQCMDPVLGCIRQDVLTAGGVCESISAFWIAHHSSDSSLWNWLTAMNGNRLAVNMGPLWQVMALQREGCRPNADQRRVTNSYLKTQNIIPLQVNIGQSIGGRIAAAHGSRPSVKGSGGGVFNFGRGGGDIADAILLDITKKAGCYKLISFEGMGGAHTMCAWVAQDVSFFDPNFGEFYFDNPQDFRVWFASHFWMTSNYWAGLSGETSISSYGKQIIF